MISTLANDIENEIKNNNINFDSEKIKNLISKFDFNDIGKYLTGKENRIKIYENEILDIYLLIWNIGEISKIHNHAKNGCWLKVLKGSLIENRYDTDFNLTKVSFFKKDNVSFMRDDIGYHNIENIGNEVSISLHFYSPPGHETIYFEN